jgi:uracil-DNA glycosylase family 4
LFKNITELRKSCAVCMDCELCKTRTNVVFGVGNENTELLFVGEGPGEQEDLKGEPFVGRAGKLLDTMLELIYLDRSKIYIANIVKCRPPKNRDPRPEEKAECEKWLKEQIRLIDPKIIVCLGRIAACYFMGDDFKISRDHGKFFDIAGRRVMALYHPAALLRDPRRRPETFSDLKVLESEIKKICERI